MSDTKQPDDGTVIYGGKVYKKPKNSAWPIWIFYGLLLFVIFAVTGPVGGIIALTIGAIVRLAGKGAEKRHTSERDAFMALCRDGLECKSNYSDGERGFFLALNEAMRVI